MPVFSISYDLIKRKDYKTLYAELDRLGAKPLLLSQRGVRMVQGTTAVALRDHLKGFIDADDRLVIIQIDGTDWATWNALTDISKL